MWLPYSALFGWLAFTDGYTGHHTWVLTLTGVFSVILVGFALLKSPKPKPLTPYLLAFLAVQLGAFFYNHSVDIYPLWRTVVWIAVYQLQWPQKHVRTGAFYTGVVYALISPFLSTNTNIIAFNLWTLYFLSQRRDIWFGALVFVAMLITKSEGGLLAFGVGLAYQQFGARALYLSPVALFGIWAIKQWGIWGGHTNAVRLAVLQYAWAGFKRSPWFGNYGGFNYVRADGWQAWHAHNIIADIGFQTGIIGLLILFAIGVLFYRQRWTPTVLSVAFIAHSMVDSPMWFFLPAMGVFMELAYNGNHTRFVWRIDWLNVCRHRPRPGVAGKTSLSVDARTPADRVAHSVD